MEAKRIRGPKAEARCTNKSSWGSPLYCDCGCQEPREDDFSYDLNGVTVGPKSTEGYANVDLMRDGKCCGQVNTQHNYVALDDTEYLGILETSPLMDLIRQARVVLSSSRPTILSAGDTLAETSAAVRLSEKLADMEQDERNRNHPGYCTKCHSFCYGDCEA